MREKTAGLFFIIAIFSLLNLAHAQTPKDQIIEHENFGDNPGQLKMYTYSPTPDKLLPAVVLLHGCTQTAKDYAYGSGWLELAQRHQIQLIMPEQQRSNNEARCFNWFYPDQATRGNGEAESIKQIIEHAHSILRISNEKLFITGFSGGAAMTAVMIASYPEIFSAATTVAGVPFQCAKNVTNAFMCMGGMRTMTAERLAQKVFDQTSPNNRWPSISSWHGEFDFTVRPVNTYELVKQWTRVHGITDLNDGSADENVNLDPNSDIEITQFQNQHGDTVVRTYYVKGMRHGQAVDPDNGCGDNRVHFMLDERLCAAEMIGREWGIIK